MKITSWAKACCAWYHNASHKQKTIAFVLACYVCTFCANVGIDTFQCASHAIGRATGSIVEQQYTFDTLTLSGIEAQSATIATSVDNDPQLLLENLQGDVVDVRFQIAFDTPPGEVNLYYAKQGEPFRKEKKIWGKQKSDGSYVFAMPYGQIDAIRVDPTSFAGVTMDLQSFTVNAPRSVASYFAITYEQLFAFILYPALFAAFAAWAKQEIVPLIKHWHKKEGKSK